MQPSKADRHLSDHGAGGGTLVLPGGREDTDGLVVAGQTVDTRLDQNETELAVLVVAVTLEVLADGDGLFDQLRSGAQGDNRLKGIIPS